MIVDKKGIKSKLLSHSSVDWRLASWFIYVCSYKYVLSEVAQLPGHFAACSGSELCSKCEYLASIVARLANNCVHQLLLRLYFTV